MTDVRVTDASLEIADQTGIYRLAVAMVPGRYGAGPREIDAEHLHPAVREHLATWAAGPSLLPDLIEELRVLQTQITLGEPKPAEIAAGLGNLVERYTR